MSKEAAFVAALARGGGDEVRALHHERLNWLRVEQLASIHQVDALCSWMLGHVVEEGGVAPVALPTGLRRSLRESHQRHYLENDRLRRELADLDAALEEQGVRALYLKGPWMAFQAYPDAGTRPIGDIDLCIQEQAYDRALRALDRIGYRSGQPLAKDGETALRRAHYREQLRFGAPRRRLLEMHFRLVNLGPGLGDERWVWETARELIVCGRPIEVPGPEAMLLQLMIHANQHGFTPLRLLFDIRWALSSDRGKLDVDRLLFQVEELRCESVAYHAVELARQLVGAAPPTRLLDALRPGAMRRTRFATTWNLAAVRRLEVRRRRHEFEIPKLYLFEFGRLRDKLRYARGIVAEAGGLRSLIAALLRSLRPGPDRGGHAPP